MAEAKSNASDGENATTPDRIGKANSVRIERLAELGRYVASDLGNYADCQHETMIDRLRTAGVVSTHEKQAATVEVTT